MKKVMIGIAMLGTALFLLASFAFSFEGDAKAGMAVYDAQKCKLCHSIEGVGNKKSPLDGVGSKLPAAELIKWIKTPKEMKADTKMKAYPNLSDKELNDLVAYMLSLKAK